MWAGDKQGIGGKVIINVATLKLSQTAGDIMDFIAVVSMAVRGNRPGKAFMDDIQGPDGNGIYLEMNVKVCI